MQFIFGKHDIGQTPSASYTESALPIPKVLASDYQYQDIMKAIDSHPHLFKIVTPIKSNPFRSLLLSHPNQDLIGSVIHRLAHGFWPFANTEDPKTMLQGIVLQGQQMPDLDNKSVQFLK